MNDGEAMKPGSVDDPLTVPCEGIGVWLGACVVHADGRVGVVVATGELAGQPGAWVAFGVGINSVPESGFHLAQVLALDLTHRMTRLEALTRLVERRTGLRCQGVSWRASNNQPYRWFITSPAYREDFGGFLYTSVPGLWGLEDDGKQTIDGARWVDVKALALVLRHVFGVPR
jgi:hypothetical protein